MISFLIAQSGTGYAEEQTGPPIDISAIKFSGKNIPGGREATFEGSVKVQQGDLTLHCERLVIVYDESEDSKGQSNRPKKPSLDLQSASHIRSITATGNVKTIQRDRMASAGKAVYDHVKRTITLSGGPPRLWQGSNVLVGDTITIYLDEERFEIQRGDESEVRATISPGKEMKKEKEK